MVERHPERPQRDHEQHGGATEPGPAWKDFIWPLLVLQDPEIQTLSVALQRFEPDTPINLMLAGLVLASIPMVVAFLIFQRQILAGLTAGSLKG